MSTLVSDDTGALDDTGFWDTPAAFPRPGDADYPYPWDGIWRVVTETSTYLIDFGDLTATRLPGQGGGTVPGEPEKWVSSLDLDNEPVHLRAAPDPVIGEQMDLILDTPAGSKHRLTTIVRSVELLSPGTYTDAPEHTRITGTPYTGTPSQERTP